MSHLNRPLRPVHYRPQIQPRNFMDLDSSDASSQHDSDNNYPQHDHDEYMGPFEVEFPLPPWSESRRPPKLWAPGQERKWFNAPSPGVDFHTSETSPGVEEMTRLRHRNPPTLREIAREHGKKKIVEIPLTDNVPQKISTSAFSVLLRPIVGLLAFLLAVLLCLLLVPFEMLKSLKFFFRGLSRFGEHVLNNLNVKSIKQLFHRICKTEEPTLESSTLDGRGRGRSKSNRESSGCTRCEECGNCWYCTACIACRACRWCVECTGCKDCSWCNGCVDCEDCINCRGCVGLKGARGVVGGRAA